jgi:hypothetical protein
MGNHFPYSDVFILKSSRGIYKFTPWQAGSFEPFRIISTIEQNQVSLLESCNSLGIRLPESRIDIGRNRLHHVDMFPANAVSEIRQRVVNGINR